MRPRCLPAHLKLPDLLPNLSGALRRSLVIGG
jgi:hypothetical protein